ncbi:MAG TPA: glutathione S-transferase N-terminal domain-containing protein [Solirubrobacterales bacterium]
MILYTCGQKDRHAAIGHPCGRAAKALDEAGYEYEIRDLPGYRLAPWTWGERRRDRKEVEELTGQVNLPVLVLDEGRTVVGSGKIMDWAKAHPAYQPQVGGG